MNRKNKVSHKGKVISNDNNNLKVEIEKTSACGNCHAKSACAMAGDSKRIIEVNAEGYSVGDVVEVSATTSVGMRAVFLSYLLPLAILLFLLLSLSPFLKNDLIIGLISLSFIGIYYLFIYCFRGLISNKIVFSIRKYE